MLLAGFTAAAWGQDADEKGWEIGVRYWRSTGRTHWDHNAQPVQPAFGNPTSVLDYDKLDANSIDVQLEKRWTRGLFLRGLVGAGSVASGNLNDSDYFAGQVKFSETNSAITGGNLSYAVMDVGYDFLRPGPRTALGVFAGGSYWEETLEASGATYVVPAGTAEIPQSIRVLTNNAKWYSMRIGLNGRAQVTERLYLGAALAAVPYSRLHNEDSHHLRGDLGPTPNIVMNGDGRGVQADAEVRYALFKLTEIGLGLRYWKLRSTGGEVRFAGDTPLPLNEFVSSRYGATLSLVSHW